MYESTTAQVIQELKNLLDHGYPPGPGGANLIRELVQNADDARATRLDFVLRTEGIAGARNRFLRGPALIYLNDGPFTTRDALGLRMRVGGAKGDALDKVGRFGLGQKSVYHLCEAFFYSGAESVEPSTTRDWINPWKPGRTEIELGLRHLPEWHDYEDTDKDAVEEVLSGLRSRLGYPSRQGLAVWLPLRQGEHEQNGKLLRPGTILRPEHIRPWFAHAAMMADLLPFCSHLKEIRTWEVSERATRSMLHIWRDGPGLRRPVGEAASRLEGTCRVLRDGELVLRAWTSDHYARDLGADLRHREGWPQRTSVVDGAWQDDPEKAAGFGAVVILRRFGPQVEPRKIESRLAVYYPLSSEAQQAQESLTEFAMVLHGCFLPSPDRKQILGLTVEAGEPTDQQVRQEWNLRVLEKLTVPGLVQALQAVLTTLADEDPASAEALVRFVAQDSLVPLKKLTEQVREAQSLVLVLRAGRWRWTRLDSVSRMRKVPAALAKQEKLCAWLAETLPGENLVREDAPHLSLSGRYDPWTAEQLNAFLDRADPGELQRSDELIGDLATGTRALIDRYVELKGHPAARSAVARLVARLIAGGAYDRLHEARDRWEPLLAALESTRACFIGGRERAAPTVRRLARAHVSGGLLILPESLKPQGWTDSAALDLAVASPTLRHLIDLAASDDDLGAINSACFVLSALVRLVGAERVKADPALGSLRFVRCWSTSREDVTITIAELEAANVEGRVVASRGQPVQPIASTVARVLGGAEVILLGPEFESLILNIAPLGWPAVARMLRGRQADLGPIEERASLLGTLIKPPLGLPELKVEAANRADFRFLLHGSGTHRLDESPLYRQEVGTRLGLDGMREVLKATERPHALLDPRVVDLLSGEMLRTAGVEPMTDDRALELAIGLGAQKALLITEITRSELLALAPSMEIWRRLPLHRLQGGGRSSIDAGVFRPGASPVPMRMASLIRLLDLSERDLQDTRYESVPGWDALAVVRTALAQERPHLYCEDVLTALGAMTAETRAGVSDQLASKPWLVCDGKELGPNQVIALSSDLERLVGEMFAIASDIRPPLCTYLPAMDGLLLGWLGDHLFLRGTHAFEVIRRAFSRLPEDTKARWRILPRWDAPMVSGVLSLPPGLSLGRGWEVLRLMVGQQGGGQEPAPAPALARDLVGVLSPDAQVTALQALADHARSAGDPAQRERVLGLYFTMLGAFAGEPAFDEHVLPRITLPAQDGTWRPAREIARHGDGLASRFRLHTGAQAHFARLMVAESHLEDDAVDLGDGARPQWDDVAQAGPRLRELLDPWRAVVHDTPILVLLSLLGSSQGVNAFALSLDGGHSVAWARDAIFHATPMGDELVRQTLDRPLDFGVLLCEPGKQVVCTALTGDLLDATTDEQAPSALTVGDVALTPMPRWLRLRRYQPTGRADALAVLRETILRLARGRGIRIAGPDGASSSFHEWWEREVCGAAQAELGPQISRLVAELPSQLRVLGSLENQPIREALREFEDADLRLREISAQNPWDDLLKRAHKSRDDALEDLRETVVEQRLAILDRIQARMGAYQYQISGVVFELIQNADDATMQREVASDLSAIHVTMSAALWSIRHRGRRINDAQGDAQDPRGYRRDLVNMVLLHASAKPGERAGDLQPGAQQTTGCFGLGFKSVYLVTDTPRIWSGWLSFEIEAGLVPKAIPERGDLDRQETLIELPVRADAADVQRARERVAGLLPLVPVLARAIRQVALTLPERRVDALWRPDVISPELEVGELASSALFVGGGHVLKIRGPEGTAALLIWVKHGKCEPMPKEVATLWVTAPTTEHWNLGFVINGPLALDVGRSRVDLQSVPTRRTLQALGDGLCSALRVVAEQWSAGMQAALELFDANERSDVLLDSMFSTLLGSVMTQPEERKVALQALLGGSRGLAQWIRLGAWVPTGLQSPWLVRAPATAVRYVAESLLLNERVRGFLGALPGGGPGPEDGKVVDQVTAGWLEWLGVIPTLRSWGLHDELSQRFPGGSAITAEAARSLVGLVDLAREVAGLRDATRPWTDGIVVTSLNGDARPPGELLIPEIPEAVRRVINSRFDGRSDLMEGLDDEAAIAGFAPPQHVLSRDFVHDADALWFFRRFAREQRRTGNEDQLELWAHGAGAADLQQAVLRFLLRSAKAGELCRRLRWRRPAWMSTIEMLQQLVRDWNETEKTEIVTRLFPPRDVQAAVAANRPSEASPQPVRVERLFEQVAGWWGRPEVRRAVTDEYERRVLPHPWTGPMLGSALRGEHDEGEAKQREAWLLLLTLGHTLLYGRFKAEVHKAFFEDCMGSTLWSVLLAQPFSPEAWLREMQRRAGFSREYETWYHWRALLLDFLRIAPSVDDYVHLFTTVDRRPAPLDVIRLIAPGADPEQMLGGLQAPTLSGLRGLGVHFVLRELLRLGVIADPSNVVAPFCFVPRLRIREMLGRFQMELDASPVRASLEIHRKAGDVLGQGGATFSQCFDLPLYHIALNPLLEQCAREGALVGMRWPAVGVTEVEPPSDEIEI